MLESVKRLFLGFALIGLASGVLLYSDLRSRNRSQQRLGQPAAGMKQFRVALVQHASLAPLDDGVRGVIEAMAARGYAERVQKIVGTEPVPGDYWQTATIGEVFLMQSDYEGAARLYQAAVDAAPEERGSHETTWKQACRLMAKLSPSADDRARIRQVFAHLPDCT